MRKHQAPRQCFLIGLKKNKCSGGYQKPQVTCSGANHIFKKWVYYVSVEFKFTIFLSLGLLES